MSNAAYHPADSLSLNLGKGEIALWSGAAAFVLAAHLAGVWYLNRVPAMEAPSLDAAPAIMMELAPMVVAPEAVLNETAEVVDSAPAEEVEEVVEEMDPVEEPVLEEVVEEVAELEPAETLEDVVEELEEVPLPEVAMAVPQRRPAPEKPKPIEKPIEKPVEKKVEKKQSKPQVAATKSATNAPATAAPRVAKAAAGSAISPARWQSRVNAHLNRRKRTPRGTRSIGTVNIRFTINQSGDVVGVVLAGSSGDPVLDEAAIDLVRRASPVPAPPPEIAKSRMSLVVPIRYSR